MTFLQYLIDVKEMREKTAQVYNLAISCEDQEKYKSSRKRARKLHSDYEDHTAPNGTDVEPNAVARPPAKSRNKRICESIRDLLNIETTNTKRIAMIRILLGEK